MSVERQARLNALGFVLWSVLDDSWLQRYEELKVYKRACGNCLVPQRYKKNPQLGRWVNNQRNRKKKLPQEKILLDSLGFKW